MLKQILSFKNGVGRSQGRPPFFIRSENGSVLMYIFLAMGLLAAMTFAFTKDSSENVSTQNAYRISADLYAQINMIRTAVLECTIEFPAGGGDLDGDTDVDAADNDNRPYPLSPNDPNNPDSAAGNDFARNMECPGAPSGEENIFSGAGAKGRFLPPPPSGFGEWDYLNDNNGVRLQIEGSSNDTQTNGALSRLLNKFDSCGAELDYSGCGDQCFTLWIKRKAATCP